jgi:hypothetical protein
MKTGEERLSNLGYGLEGEIDELLTINLCRVEATVLYFKHIKIICKVICSFFFLLGKRVKKKERRRKKRMKLGFIRFYQTCNICIKIMILNKALHIARTGSQSSGRVREIGDGFEYVLQDSAFILLLTLTI